MMQFDATLTGRLPNELANAISNAVFASLQKGMETDEICCVAFAVLADYARADYGDAYLADLCKILMSKAGTPLPGRRSP